MEKWDYLTIELQTNHSETSNWKKYKLGCELFKQSVDSIGGSRLGIGVLHCCKCSSHSK